MIQTKRLSLRPIELIDKSPVFSYRSNAEDNKYQSWIPEKLEEVETFILKNPEEFNQADTWFQLVMIELSSKKVIGDIGIHFIDEKQCELGCTLSKEFQGNGFANEALSALILYLFEKLKKHRILASVDPANTPSINMLEALGFRKEAHFKQSLWLNGKWVDDVIYAMLKSDLSQKSELFQ